MNRKRFPGRRSECIPLMKVTYTGPGSIQKFMDETDHKNTSDQTKKVLRGLKRTSSAEDKATAGLALSIIALVSVETDDSRAQQLLKTLKDLNL
jgi:hypothetical protein